MSGTVAIGLALAGAPVTVVDINGKTATSTSGSNGAYSVSISGMTAPFLISAVDKSGVSGTLYSVVGNTNTSGGAPITANVTPLTTAVTAFMTSSGNPLDLAGAGMSNINASSIQAAVARLNAAIAPILSKYQLPAESFDPIGTAFAPDQSGHDAVIDSVAIMPSTQGKGLQIVSLANPNQAIQLNSTGNSSTPLSAPAQSANYLATLQSQFAQCMIDMANGLTGSAACVSSIAPNYKRGGITNFAVAHPSFARKGTILNGVKTLAFLPAGTLPAITRPAALVHFLITEPDGAPNFGSDIVQQKPDGSWNIIGNQADFNVYIASFLTKVQSVKGGSVGNAHYESGLEIDIMNGMFSAANANINTAVVQGPGLPVAGLQLKPESKRFLPTPMTAGIVIPTSTYMSIPTPAPTSIEVCSTCDGSVSATRQYKMTWAAADGGTMEKPANTADYASSQVDLTALPQYAVYTITFYDKNAVQIGQPQKILNIAPYVTAAAGPSTQWSTISKDAIANFLTPGGSAAMGTVQSSTIGWTPPANAALPNTWISIAAIQTISGTTPYGAYERSSVTNTSNANGTISTAFSAVTVSEGLNDELMREIQINNQVNGVYYRNAWRYQRNTN